jgi:transposase-like protein
MDIETSPNIGFFWKSGYKLTISPDNIIREKAIICICYKWEGQKAVHTLQWDEGDDRAMVEAFVPIMDQCDEMVGHNLDRFDLKWFNSQCLKHGLTPPLQPKTVDTLIVARRRFYLNSNRLDYLGKFLFGEGKIRTDFGLWKDITLRNDEAAMRKMVTYCKGDVRLLERVYEAVIGYHEPKSHAGVMLGLPRWTCAHCASESVRQKKRRVTSRGTVQHSMVCKDCHRHSTINHKVYLDLLDWQNRQAVLLAAEKE